MNRDQIRRSGRHSGMVQRYHTWPTIQRQTIADHTWNMIRIYWEIFGPEIEPTTLSRMLWHDAGESVAGDPPFPVKRDNHDLKTAHDRVEQDAVMQIAGEDAVPVVADSEVWRMKVCDLLEMAEFGAVEASLGSQYGWPVVEDTLEGVWWMLDTGRSHWDCGHVRDWILRHEQEALQHRWTQVCQRLGSQRAVEMNST